MLLAGCLCSGLAAQGPVRAAGRAPQLCKLSGLRAGLAYRVLFNHQKHDIGLVTVQRCTDSLLEVKANVDVAGVGGFRGAIGLRFQHPTGKLGLRIDGRQANGSVEAHQETVDYDLLLARSSILTFRYKAGTRFFQLSRDSSGLTKVATDWGIVALMPIRRER